MIVALLGDVEGDTDWTVARLDEVGRRGDVRWVLQLGDLRYGTRLDLAAVEKACARHGLQMLCAGGNHEHWERLAAVLADDARPLAVSEHVVFLPRGHRWSLGGRAFVALGGAPSVNRHLLTEGVDWWPTEVVRPRDVEVTLAGGYADVMLTHDSPAPPWCTDPVARVIRENPHGWPAESLAYAMEGLDLLTRAVLGVRPRLLAHGHFHVAGETAVRLPGADHDTTVWSLAANGEAGNLRLLDLTTLREPTPA